MRLDSTVEGKKISIYLRTNGTDVGVLADVFLRRIYRFNGNEIRTILDLGGNIGLATVYLAALHPTASIATVEPDEANLAVMRRTVNENHLNVRLFPVAIGIADGTATMHLNSDPSANSLDPACLSLSTVEVPQLTVESIRESMGWDYIDLVKIDIEGYEKTLFGTNPGWLRRVGNIIGEIHSHVGYTLEALRKDLCPFGFSVAEIAGGDTASGLTIFLATRQA